MTLAALEFELPRRSIIFHRDTEMSDLTLMGYTGDPNLAGTTGNESLLYYAPATSAYCDKSTTPFTYWDKAEDGPGGLWVLRGSGGVSTGIHVHATTPPEDPTAFPFWLR